MSTIEQCHRQVEKHVRFLSAGTRTSTTELLGLHSPGVGNEECSVVRNELLLKLHRAVCVDILGVVRDESLGDRLADSVHLRSVSTTLDAETDVNCRERLLASNEDGLVDLHTEDLGLEEGERRAVNVDQTTTLLGVCNRGGGLCWI